MAKVEDVAKAVLELKEPMTTMKLQKLIFYAQAYSLAFDSKLLTNARFEAWVNGPVSPDLYHMHQGRFMVWAESLPQSADAGNLSKREYDIIGRVVKTLGDLSGEQLRELSHSERPWADARRGLSPRDRSNVEITQDAIKSFYNNCPANNPLFA